MIKTKQYGRSKLKGSADARRDSTPRKGGRQLLDRDDENALSRMLPDWRAKEEESEQGATVDGVIEGLIRRTSGSTRRLPPCYRLQPRPIEQEEEETKASYTSYTCDT